MKLTIVSVSKTNTEGTYEIKLRVGDKEFVDELTAVPYKVEDSDVWGYNFSGILLNLILSSCGQLRRFASDFSSYMNGGRPLLPWDYGEQDESVLKEVFNHHKKKLRGGRS